MVKVLFVCMGNICRSPTAHGVFRDLVMEAGLSDQVYIDSAGTHAYHIGKTPDPRSMAMAAEQGVDISDLRARQVHESDFEKFDYILAMDAENLAALKMICPKQYQHKLMYLLSFDPEAQSPEVPDPYYGGPMGFLRVYNMVERAAENLLAEVSPREYAFA